MKNSFVTFTLITLLCSTVSHAQQNLEPLYRIIKSKPQIQLSLLDSNIRIINIYKMQILSLVVSKDKSEDERLSQYVNDVYLPYQEFWNNFFDETGFRKWVQKNLEKLQSITTPGLVIPFEIDFDSLFIATVGNMKTLTSREPQGKWYLVYGNKASNIGGFYNGDMFVDFFGIGKYGVTDLIFSLPHEINHQIFEKSNSDDNTLLHTILDEGFACYVNYLYWNKKYSPAMNITFTEEEWKWCIENEERIFSYAKMFLDSTNREVIGKFQKAHYFIFDDAPDRIAYFIGFRICEAYVEKCGNNAWKDIYTRKPKEILRASRYMSMEDN